MLDMACRDQDIHSICTQYALNVYSTYCEIAHVQRLWAWPTGNTITCMQYVFNMYTICTQYVLKMYSTFGEVANVGQRLPGPPHVSNVHSFFCFLLVSGLTLSPATPEVHHHLMCIRRNVHAICTQYARNMHAICTQYARNMHAICTQYALDVYSLC
jgi:hypothetical protein